MADIMKCKECGFVSFYIQASAHAKRKHPDKLFEQVFEKVGDSDADLKRYGFRPSIEYYKAKLQGRDVSPWDFEKRNRT